MQVLSLLSGSLSLYLKHNQAGELDANNFSRKYLEDRADFLAIRSLTNLGHQQYSDIANHIQYEDLETGKLVYLPGTERTTNWYTFGSDSSETIRGGSTGGDDHLYGRGGEDTIIGGDGADYLEGGDGNDRLYAQGRYARYEQDSNILHGGKGHDDLYGADGDDVLNGGEGIDYLAGGKGDDTYKADVADTIRDEDRIGRVFLNGTLLSGGSWSDEEDAYVSDNGRFYYYWSGSTLYVEDAEPPEDAEETNGVLKIENFRESGDLRIDLIGGDNRNGNGGGSSDWPVGDGFPNGESDQDGDGIADSEDDDIDGDGIPNESDSTPFGGEDLPLHPFENTSTPTLGSPLVLDLDGDGVETVGLDSDIHFDHGGDSFKELTGFAGADDGLLALDRNGDGVINNGHELFGNSTIMSNGQTANNGFQALSDFDSNADGRIDENDDVFTSLRVFKDSNLNGLSDPGELLTLEQAGIQYLSLSYVNSSYTDSFGNIHKQIGSYKTLNGESHTMSDVWFKRNLTDSEEEIIEVPFEIQSLANAKGYGTTHSLHQAMARQPDGELRKLVEEFSQQDGFVNRRSMVQKIIFAWTGQTGDYRPYAPSAVDAI